MQTAQLSNSNVTEFAVSVTMRDLAGTTFPLGFKIVWPFVQQFRRSYYLNSLRLGDVGFLLLKLEMVFRHRRAVGESVHVKPGNTRDACSLHAACIRRYNSGCIQAACIPNGAPA